MNNDIHEVQGSILRELLFHNGTNFSSLNKLGLPNDHFVFHIKRLMNEGIVEKKDKLYFLTQKGKQIAGKLDIDTNKIEKFGTPGVIVTVKKIIDGKLYYLVQQRLKEPFYGYYGFINGKVRFGERTENTAKRELQEETGLTGEPTLVFINHKLNGSSPDQIKLDNFFFVYVAKEVSGELVDTIEGKHSWKTLSEIMKLQTFPGFETVVSAIEKESALQYLEQFVELENI
jgi:8-oxo-dGTP pyrophosphatase MutT (NUDIX family)